jgi:hypothetical protein
MRESLNIREFPEFSGCKKNTNPLKDTIREPDVFHDPHPCARFVRKNSINCKAAARRQTYYK